MNSENNREIIQKQNSQNHRNIIQKNINNRNRRLPPLIHYPKWIEESEARVLWGYFHEAANEYHIISADPENPPAHSFKIVEIAHSARLAKTKKKTAPGKGGLTAYYTEKGLLFFQNGKKCMQAPYNRMMDVFFRNTRDSDKAGTPGMNSHSENCVLISGLGSVGSSTALKLAGNGVNKFLLIDDDVMVYQNIFRHQCGILDVGKFKVEAVKERILQINPNAQVNTFVGMIENVPQKILDGCIDENSVIVGCTDNKESDLYANIISQIYQIPLVTVGFSEEATAGEIFFSIPDETPCYRCFCDAGLPSLSESFQKKLYRKDKNEIAVESEIPTDISLVTNFGTKIIGALISRNKEKFDASLLDSQYTLICNNNHHHTPGKTAAKNSAAFTSPRPLNYSFKPDYSAGCSFCKEKIDSNHHRQKIPG